MKFLAQIKEQLRGTTGFNHQFLPDEAVRLAVRHRMEALQQLDEAAFWARLQGNASEWGRLIDELVVTETWFLRDEKPFHFLAEEVKKRGLGAREGPRILSAPCSTGEEPYSIAITLAEAGIPLDRVRIDAVDISERALRFAREHTYRTQAFRGGDLGQSRYFERVAAGEFRVVPEIHQAVRFFQANLLDPGFLIQEKPYDFIFCRNLLIYLDDPARARTLANLERLLGESSVLLVGHADAGVLTKGGYRPVGPSSAFAFAKGTRALQLVPAGPVATIPKPPPKPARPTPPPAVPKPVRPMPPPAKPALSQSELLNEATRCADAGELGEAARHCVEYLKGRRACPHGLHLLAVIRLAEGNRKEAEALFNQVAYLDPNHVEAMLHLAHLCEARGDQAGAIRWRDRRERTMSLPAR